MDYNNFTPLLYKGTAFAHGSMLRAVLRQMFPKCWLSAAVAQPHPLWAWWQGCGKLSKICRVSQAELQLLVKKTLPVVHLFYLQMQYQNASATFSKNCRTSWGAEAEFDTALCKSPAALALELFPCCSSCRWSWGTCKLQWCCCVKLCWWSGIVCAALSKLL